MTHTPFYIFGLKLKKRYLGFGHFLPLVSSLRFLSGFRQTLEIVTIYSQYFCPIKIPCKATKQLKGWSEITTQLGSPKGAFLFLNGWFKQTEFVGVLDFGTDGKKFVKAYKNIDEVMLASPQATFVETHFSDFFKLSSVINLTPHCVIYEHLEREDNVSPKDLYQVGYDCALTLYKKHKHERKNIDSFLILDMPMLFEKYDAKKIWDSAYQHLENIKDISFVPAHGDFVPWNAFRDERGEIALIDYERCGWHVPFYDLFHLIIQPQIIHGTPIFPDRLIKQIVQDTQETTKEVLTWLMLYLLDQLYFSLDDYINHDMRYPHLKKSLKARLSILRHTTHLLKSEDTHDA